MNAWTELLFWLAAMVCVVLANEERLRYLQHQPLREQWRHFFDQSEMLDALDIADLVLAFWASANALVLLVEVTAAAPQYHLNRAGTAVASYMVVILVTIATEMFCRWRIRRVRGRQPKAPDDPLA